MSDYDIGYLDGRNHALSLIARWAKTKECNLDTIKDRDTLEDALEGFDPGFFNNYDERIGPIY